MKFYVLRSIDQMKRIAADNFLQLDYLTQGPSFANSKNAFSELTKSYDELKPEIEVIQQQMAEAKQNEGASTLKEIKRLCKEFFFFVGMFRGSLAEGRKKI